MKVATRKHINIVFNDSFKVGLWIFVSAGVTALASWLLSQPELFQWYGVLNFVLYLIKKLDKQFRNQK
jgi:hypothetical protein